MSADVKTIAGEVADAHREASMARIAMSQMERQHDHATDRYANHPPNHPPSTQSAQRTQDEQASQDLHRYRLY